MKIGNRYYNIFTLLLIGIAMYGSFQIIMFLAYATSITSDESLAIILKGIGIAVLSYTAYKIQIKTKERVN